MMGQHWGMSANMLRTVGSQGASIQNSATRIKSLSWPLTCSARNLDKTRGTNAGGGNISYLKCPGMVESIQPRSPEVVEFPRCNNAGITWYWRMPADPPLVDPKGQSCLSHLRDKMLLQKQPTLVQVIGLHIGIGKNVCWNMSNTVLVSQTQYPLVQPGKKRRHCTTLITQISFYSAVIQMQGNHLTR